MDEARGSVAEAQTSPLFGASDAPLASTKDFLSAMSLMASTVTVITTTGQDQCGIKGLTATAFCSLTADPPSVLVCINKSSVTHDAIKRTGVFCVNVLSASQDAIATVFATTKTAETRFEHLAWSSLATGAPALEHCVANLDCRARGIIDSGTHSIFIGEAAAIRSDPAQTPLLYLNRSFCSVAPARSA